MILKDAVQTSFLTVGFFTLIVFGLSYYFILSDIEPSNQPLKDALSITASFFGGFATLTAAYIASILFNDWRVVQTGHNHSELAKSLQYSAINLQTTLEFFRERAYAFAGRPPTTKDLDVIKDLKDRFTNEHFDLHKKLTIDLRAYEQVIGIKIIDTATIQFKNYFFSINGLYEDIIMQKPHDCARILNTNHLINIQEEKFDTYIASIVQKTHAHIKPNNEKSK